MANSYKFHHTINDTYEVSCEMERRRVECAIMIKAALLIRRGWQIMKKSKGIISLILTVVLIALLGFTTVVGFGKEQTGQQRILSLDLTWKAESVLPIR